MRSGIYFLLSQESAAEIEAGKKIFIAGLTSRFALVITPDLWRNWEAVLNNQSAFILSHTVKTIPPVLTDTVILPFTLLLLLTLLFSIIRLKNLSANHIFLLTELRLAALLMSRNIPLFAIACAPILSVLLKDSLGQFKKQDVQRVNLGRLYSVVGVAQACVLLDSQSDFYGEGLTREYAHVMSLEYGWEAVLKKYDVTWVVVQSDKPLVNAPQEDLDWDIVCRDDTATVRVLHEKRGIASPISDVK